MKGDILVTGSLAFDFIMDFPGTFADNIDPTKLHILNLSFQVNSLKKERGGTAGNIAYSLALLGSPPAILGTVGQDFGSYAEFLKKKGVDISNIKVISSDYSSQAFITTDIKDNQIHAFYPGAMEKVLNLSFKNIKPVPHFVIISPNHPKVMMNLVSDCQKLKTTYLFDPGMQLSSLKDKDLIKGIKGAHILIGNDYEIGLIKTRLKMTDLDLLKKVNILITTLGDRGSIIKTKQEEVTIDVAKPKKVVDPTGAGDAYRAGFLAGYLRGFDLQTCGQMGAVASCYAVEKYGTTNHSFSPRDFCLRYKNNFREKLSL